MAPTKVVFIVLGLTTMAAAQLSGDARIYVINATDVRIFGLTEPTPFTYLDVNGGVTPDMTACAVFNKLSVYRYIISTSAGNYTLQDAKQPENTKGPITSHRLPLIYNYDYY